MICRILTRALALPGIYRCGVAMKAGRIHMLYRSARFLLTGRTGRYQVGNLYKVTPK